MIKIPEENKHFSKKSLAQPLKNTQSIPFPIPKKTMFLRLLSWQLA